VSRLWGLPSILKGGGEELDSEDRGVGEHKVLLVEESMRYLIETG
jgi:hypothetical protein